MIGMLDSGLSALRLAAAIRRFLPEHDMLLYADTACGPWGVRSSDAICAAVVRGAHFLTGQGARLLVVASHSAAAVAMETLKQHVRVPLLEVVTPAAAAALDLSRESRIGVLGSPALISSQGYESALLSRSSAAVVFSAAAPLVLPLVECGWLKKPETHMILKKYLHPLKVRQVATLICAGGHLGLLEGVIRRKMGRRVSVVDPCEALARRLAGYLSAHPDLDRLLEKNRRLTCAVSDVTPGSGKLAALYFGGRVRLQPVPSNGYSRAV